MTGSDAITYEYRTRYYGRDFRGTIEVECIGKSALSGRADFRPLRSEVKDIEQARIVLAAARACRPARHARRTWRLSPGYLSTAFG